MTKILSSARRKGRPLPAADPEALRRAHRISGMAEVGALLRAERAARGLSQADMATRLGISRQHLVALEAGSEGVASGTVFRLLADLGVHLLAFPPAALEDPIRALELSVERQ